jgi:Calpain family cysteine protease
MSSKNRSGRPFPWQQQPVGSKKQARPPLTLEQLEARMLMAFDLLEQQVDGLSNATGPASTTANDVSTTMVESVRTFASGAAIRIQPEGATSPVVNGARLQFNTNQVVLRVLRDSKGNLPSVQWNVTSTDRLARGVVQRNGELTTISFNRPVGYTVTATVGSSTLRMNINIAPALKSLLVQAGSATLNNTPLQISGTTASVKISGLDEIGRAIRIAPETSWELIAGPEGSSPTIQSSSGRAKISFTNAGLHTFKVSNGSISQTFRVNVAQTLSGVRIEPTSSVQVTKSVQLNAAALDQFQQPMTSQPRLAWSATGGTVNSAGLFTAGSNAGTFQVSVLASRFIARASLNIVASTDGNNNGGGGETQVTGINDSALRNLVTTDYADGTLSRDEMIRIIRSVGNDNTLSAVELADLRFIVSTSNLRMPEYVRTLATSVVTTNPANLRYKGQALGNLTAGSSALHVTSLVDKWFLGSDLPTVTSSDIGYRRAVGSLFPTAPGLTDSRQGQLGDCYYLAALISIANVNQSAVRNMLIENSDGTVSVRFFANGQADYVTVDRNLPTYSNGNLAYSGFGQSVTSSATPLWLALAEKAYAQWNETGKSGRNGTNTYSAITGGWMSNVYRQVLGYNSADFAVSSLTKQSLVDALNSQQAVTIGTSGGANVGGLVGGHAYVVTGYNAATDSFSFYNPWSFQHPSNLTWTQMQGQFSLFSVASPAGSSSNGTTVRADSDSNGLQAYIIPAELKASLSQVVIVDRSVEVIAEHVPLEFNPAQTAGGNIVAHTMAERITATEESQPTDAELADLSILELV